MELSVGVLWTSPSPPDGIGKKGRSCAIFKVPLFLSEGFSQRDAFGKGEFLFLYIILTLPVYQGVNNIRSFKNILSFNR